MPYATLQQLIDSYGRALLLGLTDRGDEPTGEIDQSAVDRALANTDAVIDGYLGRRYVTPLTETPPQVADVAQAIVIYKLHTYKPDEKIEDDYRDAMKSLREMGDGTITLHVASNAPAQQTGTGARMTDRERPLTAQNLKGYI